MITHEALSLIQSTAQQAQRAFVLDIPGDGRSRIVQIGGDLQSVAVPPPPIAHQVRSLQDLIDYAKRLPETCNPVVFHDVSSVVLLLDATDRRDKVVFGLSLTKRFSMLSQFAQQTAVLSQKELIRCLTVLEIDEGTVAKFRNLNWQTIVAVNGEVMATKDRLGREVRSEVTQPDLPTSLPVHTFLYNQNGEREKYIVTCSIETDAGSQRFLLSAQQDSIEDLLDTHQKTIGKRLKEALPKVAVYYGTP